MSEKKTLVLIENAFAGGKSIQAKQTFEGDKLQTPEVIFSGDVRELVVPWVCRAADLVALVIKASRKMTIQPDAGDPIELLPGVPLVWHERSYHARPFGGDVSVLHVTRDDTGPARLRIESLERDAAVAAAAANDTGGGDDVDDLAAA